MFKKAQQIGIFLLLTFIFISIPLLVRAETVDECNKMIDEGKEYEQILRCCRRADGKIVKIQEGDEEKRECQVIGCCVFMDEKGGCTENITRGECEDKAKDKKELLRFKGECPSVILAPDELKKPEPKEELKYDHEGICWIKGLNNCLQGKYGDHYCSLKKHPVKLAVGIQGPASKETLEQLEASEEIPGGAKISGWRKYWVMGLPDYIQRIYVWVVRAVGAIAVIVIMISGFMWMVAAGNQTIISNARARIISAIVGIILAYTSYFILAVINPALVELKMPGIIRPRRMEQYVDLDYPLPEANEKGIGAECVSKYPYGGNIKQRIGTGCNDKRTCTRHLQLKYADYETWFELDDNAPQKKFPPTLSMLRGQDSGCSMTSKVIPTPGVPLPMKQGIRLPSPPDGKSEEMKEYWLIKGMDCGTYGFHSAGVKCPAGQHCFYLVVKEQLKKDGGWQYVTKIAKCVPCRNKDECPGE